MKIRFSDRFTMSLVYGTSLGAYGILMPFLPIVLHEQGFSDAQVNIILAMQGIAVLMSPLLMGYLADRHMSVRVLLSVTFLLCALLIPLWYVTDTVVSASAVAFIYFSLSVPAISMLDALIVSVGGTSSDSAAGKKGFSFQSVRIWGSIGFIVPGLLLLPLSRIVTISSFLILALGAFCMVLAGLCALLLPPNSPMRMGSGSPSQDALRAAIRPPLRELFQASAIVGIALAMFYPAFPRLLQELGYSHTAVSLIINVGVFWEILLMPFTSALIARLGTKNLVMLGIVSLPLRLICICLFPITWVLVVLQVLHAPLIIGLVVCMPIILGQLAAPQYRFSLQSVHTSLMYGFSRAIGPLLAAAIASLWGASGDLAALRAILLVASALAVIAAVSLKLSGRQKNAGM
jgi:PPP family 3-phenylpropionic acid transporter